VISHPSLEKSEGWGTLDGGRMNMTKMGGPPAHLPSAHRNAQELAQASTPADIFTKGRVSLTRCPQQIRKRQAKKRMWDIGARSLRGTSSFTSEE
jgi:hypothetical protein